MTTLFSQAVPETAMPGLRKAILGWSFSIALHGLLVAAILAIPLYLPQKIDGTRPDYTADIALNEVQLTGDVKPNHKLRAAVAARRALTPSVMVPREVARASGSLPSAGTDAPPTSPGVIGDTGETHASSGVPGGAGHGTEGISSGSSTTSDATRPLRVGGSVKPPQLISMVQPVYPPLLRRARVQGDVVIDAIVDTRGKVVQAHPVSGNEWLIPAAIDAVRQWRYEPTVRNGKPFPMFLRVIVAFRLTDG